MSIDDRLYRYVPVPPVHRDEDGYLLEDGMSQNNRHMIQTSLWCHTLKRHMPTVTVCADLPFYYERGDPHKTLVPDLFVALRAPLWEGRPSYRLWENPLPDLVIEMLSEGNSKQDIGSKFYTYEHLGIREYWLFDPEGHELNRPLVGYRLRDERYQEIAADAAGLCRSEVLGLDLHVRGDELRFRDPATGEDLRTFNESEDERTAEKNRADAEKSRADAEKKRGDVEKTRADAEKNRADAEKDRADTEKVRADAAERELARLRLRLEDP